MIRTAEKSQYTPAQLEQARWLFSGPCDFAAGAMEVHQIPVSELPEIGFCGLSNVGKSSLLNALTGRKTLARTSNTPGRTKQLNFFKLREQLTLVDMPGYGYAKASKKDIRGWNELIHEYLKGRQNLKRVCLLIDSRRGLKTSDVEIMNFLDDLAISYQLILTKRDKTKQADIEHIINTLSKSSLDHPALHPEIIITSSHKDLGIELVRASLAAFAPQKHD